MCLTSLKCKIIAVCKHVPIWIVLLVPAFLYNPSISNAQQPTATIKELNGQAVVSGTTPATVGAVLRSGDTLQTQTGASVVLELSDGSRLEIGEDTNIEIAELVQEPATGARASRVKLAWGRIRAWLSPGHQKEGSSFNVETPNALIGVKFSQPDIEVIYDPDTNTTTVFAYTVEVIITNLLTGEIETIKPGEQGIVQGKRIKTSSIPDKIRYPGEDLPPTRAFLLRTRYGVRASTGSSVPGSLPGPHARLPWSDGRSGKPERLSSYGVTINIHEQ
jgi:hypothetical protein